MIKVLVELSFGFQGRKGVRSLFRDLLSGRGPITEKRDLTPFLLFYSEEFGRTGFQGGLNWRTGSTLHT